MRVKLGERNLEFPDSWTPEQVQAHLAGEMKRAERLAKAFMSPPDPSAEINSLRGEVGGFTESLNGFKEEISKMPAQYQLAMKEALKEQETRHNEEMKGLQGEVASLRKVIESMPKRDKVKLNLTRTEDGFLSGIEEA